MATSVWSPEAFACPICLEILKDPATLPCGHTYCLSCIQKHWDQTATKGSYECPQCRQQFNPRPILARSSVLMEAMEKLRLGGQDSSDFSLHHIVTPSPDVHPSADFIGASVIPTSQVGLYPTLHSNSPQLCLLHQQVLELYCCDDKECICDECSLLGHKGHQVVHPDEERKKIQQELIQVIAQVKRNIADRERVIQSLPNVSQAHKILLQKLIKESQMCFAGLLKDIELTHSQVLQLLQAHENSSCSHIEAQTCKLQQEILQLHKRQEELKKLDGIQDSIDFLNMFRAMDATDHTANGETEILNPEAVITGVSSALESLKVGLDNLTKTSLASIFRVVNDAAALAHQDIQKSGGIYISSTSQMALQNPATKVPDFTKPEIKTKVKASSLTTHELHKEKVFPSSNPVEGCQANPAPKTREEMLKFHFQPTLDQNSVYRQIRLSDGYHKATLSAENQTYPEHPERFVYWRQVMCVEPLAGSPYYWEVEWTGQRVTVGVAYKDMERTTADDSARLGHNMRSWSLYWSGKGFSLWHDGKETALAGPKARRVGVYLDQQAGVLAFYRVSHNQAQEICCLQTNFIGPLFPSFRFWSGVGSTITICELN